MRALACQRTSSTATTSSMPLSRAISRGVLPSSSRTRVSAYDER